MEYIHVHVVYFIKNVFISRLLPVRTLPIASCPSIPATMILDYGKLKAAYISIFHSILHHLYIVFVGVSIWWLIG